MNSFDDFVEQALKRCTSEEEIERVNEEVELFRNRGWEKYIVLVVKLIKDIQQFRFFDPYNLVGSAMDSYAIRLVTTNKKESKDFLEDNNKRRILFTDTLRFTFQFHKMFMEGTLDFFKRLNDNLEAYISELGLVYTEHLIDGENARAIGSPRTKDNLIIISNNRVLEDDEKWILTETRKVRDGEIDILRKYLLIKISMFDGL